MAFPVIMLAARALGAGHSRVIFRQILPNSLGPLVVRLNFVFAYADEGPAGLTLLYSPVILADPRRQ